ncbi:hypothetical protein MTsPCn9_20520 [Croceitalea sp. MTPC9]|uniref:TapB family protein n=1 Tax=unclassified Croceitalea TaxID=2632280 RepID=UPI002B3A1AF7|nr:hypothetical protein MTsPCn6_25740 [Croceitalea sp. MTPC6]GMN17116.1 hypothetical protein MTsPCn9_20520 [Croceitalea sp. MTPC9]
MKKTFFLAALFLTVQISFSQSNCSKYYPMIEGATFEYTNYDKKGKSDGTSSYKVTNVSTDGENTSATMALELKDDKGKEIYKTDYNFTCTGNMVNVDYESLIPKNMLQQYQDMEIDISGTDLELPNDLSVGQQLSDANVSLKVSMAGGMSMNTTIDLLNRKVEKKESVTTSAGTFDCYVIYTDNNVKAVMVKQSFPSRVWFAEGVGMIKQESYNKKGKLIASTQLTAYNK